MDGIEYNSEEEVVVGVEKPIDGNAMAPHRTSTQSIMTQQRHSAGGMWQTVVIYLLSPIHGVQVQNLSFKRNFLTPFMDVNAKIQK